MDNINTKEEANVLLTSEVYENVLNTKKENIVNLKLSQANSISEISNHISNLKDLRLRLKSLRRDIKFEKRCLRAEKRKLYKINKNLEQETFLIQDINADFIKTENIKIDINKYLSKSKQKR